jgi:hypothetical protein
VPNRSSRAEARALWLIGYFGRQVFLAIGVDSVYSQASEATGAGGSYTPPVGGAGTRGSVPRVRGCLVGPRPMRFTVFVFSFFFSNFNKIRNINNF